ncbi:ABC transporter ATP-binding protein [Nocardioides gilvus]|uniref:ABC transporter ATP-binding protein n=1 Tax=Nocardioides gilvus TaxID=1735589 RepID=UPI000D74C9B8|nr:ABC transporter ATP-binding protein [Nocardioides gilvus]
MSGDENGAAPATAPGPQEPEQGREQGRDLKTTERITGVGRPGHGPGAVGVAEKANDFWPSAKRLAGRMRPERTRTALVVALTVVSVLITSIGPRILGHATDLVFSGLLASRLPVGLSQDEAVAQLRAEGDDSRADMIAAMDLVPGQGVDFGAVGQVLGWLLVLYVLAAVLAWLAGYLLNDVVQGTVRRLRGEVEGKIHRLPLDYFDRQSRGEILSRATNDIDNVASSLQQTLSQLLTALLSVFAVLAMMLWISPLLALIALVSVPLTMLVAAQVMKRSQKLFVSQWRQTGRLNSHIEEAFSGHTLVKVYGHQPASEVKFAEENDGLYQAAWSAQFVSGLIMPITMFIGNLTYVAVAVVGGLRVTSGALTLGEVQAFIQYTRQFNQPVSQVASMANLLQSGVASAERVFELLDAPEEDDGVSGELHARLGAGEGEVRFEDVSFSYDPDSSLISGLSLVARPGQTVAIVGPTGAGKTTLVNLVMRFYEVTGGRITLDGVDIASVARSDLRSRIGMVLQDTWLFRGTIAENIAFGRPDATREEILEAARATFVDRFVHSLPDGYETLIDEDGSNLSAGERQLVTIARAFLTDPELLILDEATSSVDTRTELLLQQAMSALRADRTSFVIAHRLSTIRDADVILVMEAGAIVEQGSHEELLAAGGAYARLAADQFAAAADPQE